MQLALVFGLLLLLAALLSSIAERTILSTAVLFLLAGMLFGPGALDVVSATGDDEAVSRLAELALVAVLYSDGLRLGGSGLRREWRLPGRALAFGLPCTLVVTAALAHGITGVPWADAWLIAAALSPTDPVFAVALVRRAEVPSRLRHLLNVESGINDGLALPIVVSLLATRGASDSGWLAAGRVALGTGLGVSCAWTAARLRSLSIFDVSAEYAPIGGFAIGLVVLSLAIITGGNEFLAAFAAGTTLGVLVPRARDLYEPFGAPLTEILKLAALLLFGATLSTYPLSAITFDALLFAGLSLVVARPAALLASLSGSGLTKRETIAAAWFGPKGFASVFFAFMILKSGIPDAALIFRLVATTITLSMLAHASTDVLVARWFTAEGRGPEGHQSRA